MQDALRRKLSHQLAREIDELVDHRIRGNTEEANATVDEIALSVETIISEINDDMRGICSRE